MRGRKTQYRYSLPTVKADCYAVEIEVEHSGRVSNCEFLVGFEHGTPLCRKAAGLMAAVKELQEIVMLNVAIMESGISPDDLLL